MTETPEIPQRILDAARTAAPKICDDPIFLKRIDAEIATEFRTDITDPVYDQWLAIQIKRLAALHSRGKLNDQEQESFIDAALRFAEHVAKAAENKALDAGASDALLSLAREIRQKYDEWETDLIIANNNNGRYFLEAIFRAAEGKMDRLPHELDVFLQDNFEIRHRTAEFYNRIRDFVSPLFIYEALDIPVYSDYLHLAVRHYGCQEAGPAIQTDAQALRQRISDPNLDLSVDGRPAPITLDAFQMRCDDLITSIEQSNKKNPPGGEPGGSSHGRGGGRGRR